ncbi:MAG: tetratricopeptide repeat protein [bacterium]
MKRIQLVLLVAIAIGYNYLYAGGIKEKLGIGFNVNIQKLYGDTHSGKFVYGSNPFVVRLSLNPKTYLESDIGYAQLSDGSGLDTKFINMGMKLGYRFMQDKRLNPVVYFGLGVFNFAVNHGSRFWDGYGAIGTGTEFFVNNHISVNVTGDFRYTTGDDFDGSRNEQGKDGFFNVSFGLNYYLENRSRFTPETDTFELTDQDSPIEEIASDAEMMKDYTPMSDSTYSSERDSQKEELLKSIAEKNKIIRLLRVKLHSFDQQTQLLQDKLTDDGITTSVATHSEAANNLFNQNFRIGLDYFAAEQYEDAIFTFKSLLTENPTNPEANNCWYWLGECYYNIQDYDAAIAAFEQALMTMPNSFKSEISQLMLGLSHWKSGDLTQAKADFEKILQNTHDGNLESLVHEYLVELEVNSPFN